MRLHRLRELARPDLEQFVSENLRELTEDETLAVLANRFASAAVCQKIAQQERLVAYYSVRLRLVAHRATPQAHAAKFVHYLYWPDLVRLSADVTVPAPVRRAIDNRLLTRITELTVGERISVARRCSRALVNVLLFDPDARVFAALLPNQRLREDDLLAVLASGRTTPEHIALIAADMKWSSRYSIRKALVTSALAPRHVAVAQLRHLRIGDLRAIHANAATSTYVRRCIERLQPSVSESLPVRRGENALPKAFVDGSGE